MNRIFKLVWSPALGAWTVVSELARARHAAGRVRATCAWPLRGALAAALALPLAVAAAELPTGGTVVSGSGSIATSGQAMTITQGSQTLAIDWHSFDIGSGHRVDFVQPGATSIALNRVTGSDASAIYGTLSANGRVFLVNPNGILFGQGAAVNVGSLVASTLGLSNEALLAGRYAFAGSGGSVVNRGSITAADGGAVVLLGGSVSNQGTIVASLGTVALVAGSAVTLDFAGDGLLGVQVDQGLAGALAENGQLIQADGGSVVLTAQAGDALLQSVVNNTGVIQARTLASDRTGTIALLGGTGGTVNVAGTLDASAPDGGDGGAIETSAAHVQVADGARITTLAANGRTGSWLIDPTDFTVGAGSAAQSDSGIGADTLAANLETTSVTLQTADSGSDAGDINVDAAVSWSAATTLTLIAANDIHLNAAISAGNGGLALSAGNAISASAAVEVGTFALQSGAWVQNAEGGTLPEFSAGDFRLGGGSFLRVREGDGSRADPYRVVDVYGLQGVGSSPAYLSASWALASDIDASGTASWNCDDSGSCAGFDPLGDSSNAFSGSFDGQGHSISGLAIQRGSENGVGLFGVVGSGGTVQDLGLEGGSITGASDVGGIAGQSQGTLTHVWTSGVVVGTGNAVGGLAGVNDGTIADASATGPVSGGGSNTGGLVGDNRGAISAAHATGEVSGHFRSGGLVGGNEGQISDSDATGDVIGATSYAAGIDYVGGLAGYNAGTIRGSHASGSVSGRYSVGGLVGFSDYGTVSQSDATGDVTALGYAGGLVGQNGVGAISQSYASGNVSVTGSYAGGLVGLSTRGSIDQSYATGAVSGSSSIGGLLGYGYLMSISQSYATGVATGSANVGGLVGEFYPGSITASFWNTDATATGLGSGSSSGATGKTLAELQSLSTFTAAGWDIDAAGGTGLVWRIYDGSTTPLLRSFLATLTVTGTPDYDGSAAALDNIASVSWSSSSADSSHLFGSITASSGDTLTLTSTASGQYTATSNASASGTLYSDQQGYDIVYGGIVARTISTPGSAAGDIQLPSSITWRSGTLVIDTSGRLATGSSGALATAIDGDTFRLASGTWSQNAGGGTLADFSVNDFGVDTAQAGFLRVQDGSGSAVDPYRIVDVYGLQGIASSNLLAYSYVLGSDIHASDTRNWNCDDTGGCAGLDPIGDDATPFTGSLDGQGHVISGLVINRGSQNEVGLFGEVGSSGSIANLGLEDARISGGEQVGALAGYTAGSIHGVHVDGQISGQRYVGGLAGANVGSILASDSAGVVASSSSAGGLVGANNGSLDQVHSSSVVSSSGDAAGGLAGFSYAGSITQAYATGAVQGNDSVGGLVGDLADTRLDNAYATGNVTASGNNAGGLVGYYEGGGAIANAYASGVVSGSSGVGGLVGWFRFTDASISNSYATGQVSGTSSIGGLVGLIGGGSYGGNGGSITASFYATTDTAGNAINSGLGVTGSGSGTVDAISGGRNRAQLAELATFTTDITAAGGTAWDIDDAGGTGAVWRLYAGSTTPLLRSFLTAVTVSTDASAGKTYDGSAASGRLGSYTATLADGSSADASLIAGTLGYATAGANAGSYTLADGSLSLSGLSSGQQGYDIAYAGSARYVINPATLTYLAAAVHSTYGQAPDGLAGTVTGFVNGETLASATTGTLAFTTQANGQSNAGRYAITGTGLSAGNYVFVQAAGNASALTIDPAALTITALAAGKTYDGLAWSGGNGVRYSGWVNGEDASVLSGTLVYGGNAQGAVDAGDYVITASGLGSGNYAITWIDGALAIGKAGLVVTANDASKTYDGLAWSGGNGVRYSGWVNGEDASVLSGALVYGGSAQGAVEAGDYAITASGLGSGNYTLRYVDGRLSIVQVTPPDSGDALPPGYTGALAPPAAGAVQLDAGAVAAPYQVVAGGMRVPWACAARPRPVPATPECVEQEAR